MIVWMDTEHYDYYQKRLTDTDAETLQTVIDRYTQGAEGSKRQTAILPGVARGFRHGSSISPCSIPPSRKTCERSKA